MREAVFELFERINNLDEDSQVIELQAAANGRLQELLQYALDPNIEFDLPEGPAPFTQTEEVTTHGLFWQEIRRLYVFVKGRTQLSGQRREHLFIEMLENIHPKDAALLQNIKDKIWPYEYIKPETVLRAFPGLFNA